MLGIRTLVPFLLLATLPSAVLGGGEVVRPNLIANASFDDLDGQNPRGWFGSTWGGEATFSIDPDGGRGGGPCVRVSSVTGGDASWCQVVTVSPSTDYELNAWIRTENVDRATGLGALVNLHQLQMVGKTNAVGATTDWTQVTSRFNSGEHRELSVNLLLGGWGRSTGTAWYDDIELVDLTPPLPEWTQEEGLAFFAERVEPILSEHCAECHVDPVEQKGDLYLGSRLGILTGGDRGPAVLRDDPLASPLLAAIRHETLRMPPSLKLPDPVVADLTLWVRQGLPWPAETAEQMPKRSTRPSGPVVDAETRAHWSFQPIRRPVVPAVAARDGVANPIDAFWLAKLEEQGIRPTPPTDRTTLLRRVTHDLTGLPPSRDELASFVDDTRSDAYERVVDRLLASPRFGEKWARHWLDLVRYAETNSFERDGQKPHVWRYRDYVIRSLNDDVPFDRFTIEQLAGDELESTTPDSIVATGYYRLGAWDDEPADPLQAEFDELDGILTTTSQAFLGLTLDCARCHDHKLDPLPQRDYYRMLSYFRSIRRYGDRSYDSVIDASVRSIAPEDEERRYQEVKAAHERDVAEVAAKLASIEAKVKPDFSAVELEEFAHESARVGLIERREAMLLSAAEVEAYRGLTKRRDELRAFDRPSLARALCVKEKGASPRKTHVLIRGNPHVEGDEVTPGLPEVLGRPSPAIVAPANGESTGRRLALARWLVSDENPLTPRVTVNRIWQHLLGRGLVATPNDFGLQGARPTHPELLDWLADEFVAEGWSVKKLIRTIVTSNVYRMGSRGGRRALTLDGDNSLLSRFNMRRLTAEEFRDSLLEINRTLNPAMFGPSVYPPIPAEVLAGQSRPGEGWPVSHGDAAARRSIYVHVKRSMILPILASYDFADTDFTCPERFVTTQPTQALSTLNSDFLQEQARLLAADVRREVGDDRYAQATEVLSRVLQRPPHREEVARGVRLMRELHERDRADVALAFESFCLMALNLNEFLYLD